MKATKSLRSVSSRRSGTDGRRLPSRSCGDLSQMAMTPRPSKGGWGGVVWVVVVVWGLDGFEK